MLNSNKWSILRGALRFAAATIFVASSWGAESNGAMDAATPSAGADFAKASIEKILAMPVREARAAPKVRVDGVVTAYSGDLDLLFLQDVDSAILVEAAPDGDLLRVGQKVVVRGSVMLRSGRKRVRAESIEFVGGGKLPQSLLLELSDLPDVRHEGRRVMVRGTVISHQEQVTRLLLRLRAGAVETPVYLPNYDWTDPRFGRLKGSVLTIEGVLFLRVVRGDQVRSATLIAPDWGKVRFDIMASDDPFAIEQLSIQELIELEQEDLPERRVRIRGKLVEKQAGLRCRIEDETGGIWARRRNAQIIRVGDELDAVGWVKDGPQGNWLAEADARLLGRRRSDEPGDEPADRKLIPTLTRMADVSDLNQSSLAEGRPVRLRGVATVHDSDRNIFFLQSGDKAVVVELGEDPVNLRPGMLIEIDGHTRGARSLVSVQSSELRALGADSLPDATELSVLEIRDGEAGAGWTRVEGMVRNLEKLGDSIRLRLGHQEGGTMTLEILNCRLDELPERLTETEIVAHGVSLAHVGQSSVGGEAVFLVPGPRYLETLEQAHRELFELPVTEIRELREKTIQGERGRIVHVRGVVTRFVSGESIAIQDGHYGIFATVAKSPAVRVGDKVEVVGFPGTQQRAPVLRAARVRRIARGAEPVALQLNETRIITDLLANFSVDGRLVQVEGRLLERGRVGGVPVATIQVGEKVVSSPFPMLSQSVMEELVPGALVSVTGVCRIEGGRTGLRSGWRSCRGFPGICVCWNCRPGGRQGSCLGRWRAWRL